MVKLAICICLIAAKFAFAGDVMWEIAPPFSLMPGSSGQEGSEAPKVQMSQDPEEEERTENNQQHSEPAPLVGTQDDAPQNATSTQQGQGNIEPKDSASAWYADPWNIFIVSFIALLLGGAQVYYAKKADTRDRQAAEDAVRDAHVMDRADLIVREWRVENLQQDGEAVATCGGVNAGRIKAEITESFIDCCLERDVPARPDYTTVAPHFRGVEPVIAGEPFFQSVNVTRIRTAERKAIQRGELILFFYGRLIYRDVLGERPPVVFFVQYDPRSGQFHKVHRPGYNDSD